MTAPVVVFRWMLLGHTPWLVRMALPLPPRVAGLPATVSLPTTLATAVPPGTPLMLPLSGVVTIALLPTPTGGVVVLHVPVPVHAGSPPPLAVAVFVPLVTPALFLLGVGPLARWRAAPVPQLAQRLRWAAGVGAATAAFAPMLLGPWTPLVSLGLGLAAWIAASSFTAAFERVRPQPGQPLRLRALAGSAGGMLLAHLGVAVFAAGVTVVGGFASEKDLRMRPGETADIGGLSFRLDGLAQREGPNYLALQATITVTQDDKAVATLRPERRLYTVSRMPMTEVAIDRGFTRDLYVALGESLGDGAFSVRIHHKPLVNWIWGGCLLLALGGLMAVTDRRYRVRREAAQIQAGRTAAGGAPHRSLVHASQKLP